MLDNNERGSIIAIIGTDAPLLPHELERLARRAAIGVGRGGTRSGKSSGDIFQAFSTANGRPLMQNSAAIFSLDCINDGELDAVYLAAVEAIEEAVLNALLAAEDMSSLRPAGKFCRALDHNQFIDIMRRYGRCDYLLRCYLFSTGRLYRLIELFRRQ